MLTTRKAVNLGWVRIVCTSLVKLPGESATYRACVRGQELVISPATFAAALGIAVEVDYDYSIRSDHPAASFDAIIFEILGERRRSWSGKSSLSVEFLTPDYHLLQLVIVACSD